jgi:hypothetical protein
MRERINVLYWVKPPPIFEIVGPTYLGVSLLSLFFCTVKE